MSEPDRNVSTDGQRPGTRPLPKKPHAAYLEAFLAQLLASWQSGNGDAGRVLLVELEQLAGRIRDVRFEVAGIGLNELRQASLTNAASQLEAVVDMTEQAANRIMDVAESLESLPDAEDEQLRARLAEATATIYEACNFQDLTGQRLRKVLGVLQQVEDKINSLVLIFGHTGDAAASAAGAPPAPAANETHKPQDLLNGPQLDGEGVSQDDIDALFD